ncbi:MAG: LUD domain-containing protein [Chitinophagales bacterium]
MSELSKMKILHRIQAALKQSTSKPYPDFQRPASFYQTPEGDIPLAVMFAEEFTKVSGKFVYCESEGIFLNTITELAHTEGWTYLYCWEENLQEIFEEMDFRNCRIGRNLEKSHAGLTLCECLIARTGTIILSSAQASGRQLSIFPPIHLVVAYTSQLWYDIGEGLTLIQQKYGLNMPSMISLATGPSRTADIEKTLVLGAHGPKEVYLFLIEDEI